LRVETTLVEKRRLAREAAKVWPRVGDDIFWGSGDSDVERDITGNGYGLHQKEPLRWARRVCTRDGIQKRLKDARAELAKIKGKPRKKTRDVWLRNHIKHLKQEVSPQVDAYWSECESLKEAFNADAVIEHERSTREALHANVDAIMSAPEKTMAGVVIKAQALAAWGKVPRWYLLFNLRAPDWADEMASAIIRQSGSADA